jgi:hypothetical protein
MNSVTRCAEVQETHAARLLVSSIAINADVASPTLGGRHQNACLDAIESLSLVISQEHTMKTIILFSIAMASFSTTALADARTTGHRVHHRHLVMGAGVSPALLNANASLNGTGNFNGNGSDHAMHLKNLHDSGYNPKNDVDSFGNVSIAE